MSDPYYRTASWRALRAAVLLRDPVCRMPGCGRVATVADHIVPRRQGGADGLSNLRGLCQGCHSRVTRQGQEMRPKGCDAMGRPLDPDHPWNRAGRRAGG